MQYLISFLEGIITFVSPCLLPMLPVYVSFFAGSESRSGKALKNALGFVAGFTLVFVLMGAASALIGGLLRQYGTALNIVTGAIVVVFGLNYLGVLRVVLFRGRRGGFLSRNERPVGFFVSALFGIVFSIGWTPCVGVFLGSALMLASHQNTMTQGILMLLAYSLGLGIPFLLSAVLIDRLKTAFDWIKRHYNVVTKVSGGLLVVVGVLMMTGLFGYWLSLLSV